MTVKDNASYRKGFEMISMYELAQAIQEDRRRSADTYRVASNLPREHSVSLGRYRVTVHRDPGSGLPAA